LLENKLPFIFVYTVVSVHRRNRLGNVDLRKVLMTANIKAFIAEETLELLQPVAATHTNGFNLVPLTKENVRIRGYAPPDRHEIRKLCCETGFFGKPVDTLFQDRELFADLFTKAYLDYQPEWGLVAESNGRVIGYLLGSIATNFDLLQMRSGFQTTVKMLLRLATGKYASHPRSRRFIRWLLFSGYREQPKHPRDAAHLHFDLDQNFRGRGVGFRLWNDYQKRLKDAGVKHCYGAFFSHAKRRPEVAYSRYGFGVYDRRPTTMFQPEVMDPVEVVCVSKQL
jgi:ribosomal protein S18 acetylase RimI-like enzyme